jgi:hypothetical protein
MKYYAFYDMAGFLPSVFKKHTADNLCSRLFIEAESIEDAEFVCDKLNADFDTVYFSSGTEPCVLTDNEILKALTGSNLSLTIVYRDGKMRKIGERSR